MGGHHVISCSYIISTVFTIHTTLYEQLESHNKAFEEEEAGSINTDDNLMSRRAANSLFGFADYFEKDAGSMHSLDCFDYLKLQSRTM